MELKQCITSFVCVCVLCYHNKYETEVFNVTDMYVGLIVTSKLYFCLG